MSVGRPIARASRKLRKEGLKGVFLALKWKVYRRKVLIVCEREIDGSLLEVPRLILPEGLEIVLATMDHLEMMAANFPHKREWYRLRLQTPGYYCSLAIHEGRVLAHNWFCTCPHYDPEMRCLIEPDEGQAYSFEGWCVPERRGFGISHLGMKHCLEEVLPGCDIDRIFTFLEASNLPSRKFHRRYGFRDSGRKIHLRLGPFYFNSKVKPLRLQDRT